MTQTRTLSSVSQKSPILLPPYKEPSRTCQVSGSRVLKRQDGRRRPDKLRPKRIIYPETTNDSSCLQNTLPQAKGSHRSVHRCCPQPGTWAIKKLSSAFQSACRQQIKVGTRTFLKWQSWCLTFVRDQVFQELNLSITCTWFRVMFSIYKEQGNIKMKFYHTCYNTDNS